MHNILYMLPYLLLVILLPEMGVLGMLILVIERLLFCNIKRRRDDVNGGFSNLLIDICTVSNHGNHSDGWLFKNWFLWKVVLFLTHPG